MIRKTLQERFRAKVSGSDDPDACWEWTGAKTRGHGCIRVGSPGRAIYAHRLAWEFSNGPIPDGLYVCHHCDNRGCVNPSHLFVGTCADNLADMRAKGRGFPPPHKVGADNHQAKLTDEGVREIVNLFAGGASKLSLARRYGVSHKVIRDIFAGKVWRHVTGLEPPTTAKRHRGAPAMVGGQNALKSISTPSTPESEGAG